MHHVHAPKHMPCVPVRCTQISSHEPIDAKAVPARFDSLLHYRNTLIPLVKLEVQAHLQQVCSVVSVTLVAPAVPPLGAAAASRGPGQSTTRAPLSLVLSAAAHLPVLLMGLT